MKELLFTSNNKTKLKLTFMMRDAATVIGFLGSFSFTSDSGTSS